MPAKNVDPGSSSKENSDSSQSPSPSAEIVAGEWFPGRSVEDLDWSDAKVKCPKCKEVTFAYFTKVGPDTRSVSLREDSVLEILEKQRRLEICSKCGNTRLIT